jgi:hypothetical protein
MISLSPVHTLNAQGCLGTGSESLCISSSTPGRAVGSCDTGQSPSSDGDNCRSPLGAKAKGGYAGWGILQQAAVRAGSAGFIRLHDGSEATTGRLDEARGDDECT